MADAGEETAFLDDGGVREGVGGEQLQGDVAVEARVPGSVHLPERATADGLPHLQVAPRLRRRRAGIVGAVDLGDRRHELQARDQRAVVRVRARRGGGPVDVGTVEHLARELLDAPFTKQRHAP